MYKYGIQCALEQLPERIPAIFRGTIREVAEASGKAGYDAVELYIHDPKEKNAAELKAAAADNGLSYCGVCTGLEYILNGLCLTSDDSTVRRRATDRLKEHLELGAILECPVVVGTMRGNIPGSEFKEEYLNRLADGLRLLNDCAAEIGGELLIENIHQYTSNYLCTVTEVGEYVRKLALSHLKLHIDTHSMHIEDKDPLGAILKYGDVLGYVHFSDSNRGYPGSGVIDFKAYYHALLDVDYKGYITAECQPYPNPEACAVRALNYMKCMESAAFIERMQFRE
ncbi:MAG: D-tagatose 3-epimerase [Firmicutes bacterium ADurb.Bin182]|nr:MAG: D-tagatose 3-epimerase [Firmicutes bacterium ADurb.Bin182]